MPGATGRNPLGLYAAERNAFNTCLDRLEELAGQNRPEAYGYLDNQADWAITQQFVNGPGWESLTAGEQLGYQRRLAFIKGKFRRSPSV
jgi:hypothetical protein